MALSPNSNNVYLPIYPEIKGNDYTDYQEIDCDLFKKYENLTYTNNSNTNPDNNINEYSDDILTSILDTQKEKKKRNKFQKNAICDFLRKSELITSLQREFAKDNNDTNTNTNINEIINFNDPQNAPLLEEKISSIIKSCSEILTFQTVPKGSFLFRYKDIGDKCFFLVKGRLSILKPHMIEQVSMTHDEYIRYLIELDRIEEVNLLDLVLKTNYLILSVQNIEELHQLFHSYFVIFLSKILQTKKGNITLAELDAYFIRYNQTLSSFHIERSELEEKHKQKSKGGRYLLEYTNYLLQRIKPSIEDILFFNSYKYLIGDDTLKTVTVFRYQFFMFLSPGSFLGESAIESSEKRRNASIRVEENCVVAHLPSEHYLQLIYPNCKRTKMKDLSFLCNNFFFKNLSPIIFEKHFFHFFKHGKMQYGTTLFSQGDEVKEIFFLKKGEIKIEHTGSVMSMHNMVKYLIDKVDEKNLTKFLQNDIIELKQLFLFDPEIVRIKNKDNGFKNEMNKKNKFELFLINTYSVIGIEELLLGINYQTTCSVVSNKISYMTIDVEDLKALFQNEKTAEISFYQLAFKKIFSFIKRITYLKRNLIDRAISKMKKEHGMIHSKSLAEIRTETHKSKSIFAEIKSAQVKINNEKNGIHKIAFENCLSNPQNSSNNCCPNINTKQTFLFTNSLLNKHKLPNNKLNSSALSNSSFYKPIQNMKTIVKLKKGYCTIDSIENELYNNGKNLIINQSNSRNQYIEDPIANHRTQISLINLSRVNHQEDESDQNQSIKKNCFSKKYNNTNIQKKLVKIRSISQDEVIMNISRKLEDNSEIDPSNYFIAQRVKDYYNIKKLLGYCSIVNLKNNKYGRITVLKKKINNNISLRNKISKATSMRLSQV